ncbi:hypothetical protein [Hymenobacter ruber]
MIDFVKIELPPKVGAAWAKHPDLNFSTSVGCQTGEVSPRSQARYRHLLFETFTGGRATIAGSLHKYAHGLHNGDDFPAWNVAATIAELAHAFGFRPEQATLRTVEFGLNVPLPESATNLLSRAVLYKTLPFSIEHFGGAGYYLNAAAQQYYLKLYDKQRHLVAINHPPPGPLLRVEVKVTRMVWLSDAGVVTLADLANPECLRQLGVLLAQAFQDTLFAAVAVPASLSNAEQRLLTAGSRSNYWQTLRKEHPASLRKNRQRYRELTALHAPDTLAMVVAADLPERWERLRMAAQPISESTGRAKAFIPELTDLSTEPVRVAFPGFNPLIIGEEVGIAEASATVRRCKTCGRDISGQQANSLFCSQALYGAAGKRCRNADSNPRNNVRRAAALKYQKLLTRQLACL